MLVKNWFISVQETKKAIAIELMFGGVLCEGHYLGNIRYIVYMQIDKMSVYW